MSKRVTSKIQQIPPTAGTLIEGIYDNADYRDAFLVDAGPAEFASVADFATAYFSNQPRWLSLVSMNLTSRATLMQALGDGTYVEGSSIGSWRVHGRSDDEIVFGDDMGFMQYRFSMLRRPSGQIEASTAVEYRWRRLSHVYFSLVKPVHKRFVPLSLRNALEPMPAVELVVRP